MKDLKFKSILKTGMLVAVAFLVAYGNVGQASASKFPSSVQDTGKPVCKYKSFSPAPDPTGPPPPNDTEKLVVSVRDTGSGINNISVPRTENVNAVDFTPPPPGTTTEVLITITIHDSLLAAAVDLKVTDVAGNVTNCRFDQFPSSASKVELRDQDTPSGHGISDRCGKPEVTVDSYGPTTVLVDLDSIAIRSPATTESVLTEMVAFNLVTRSDRIVCPPVGSHPGIAKVNISLDPANKTVGRITENTNTMTGRLDIPPFAPSGTGTSFFDVHFQIKTMPSGGSFSVAITNAARMMITGLTRIPPTPNDTYEAFIERFHKPNPNCTCFSSMNSTGTQVTTTIQDARPSGLGSISILKAINCTVNIPQFPVGTRDPVKVIGTKINNSQSATLLLQPYSANGEKCRVCDPVFSLVIRTTGKPETQTYAGLPEADNLVTIQNASPGVKHLEIIVNGKKFNINDLADNEVREISISSALVPGENNTVTMTGRGKPGGKVAIMIHD